MKIIKGRFSKHFLSVLIINGLFFNYCCKQYSNGKFEFILDEYIKYYKINKSEQYLLIGINTWSDSTSNIGISSCNITKNKINLSNRTFMSLYKGIKIYSDFIPMSNNLYFERITVKTENNVTELGKEYFNDLQLIYYGKQDCLLEILPKSEHNKDDEYFEKIFNEKKLMCK